MVKDIGYESAADRYKDYSWAISQAAAQILKPARRRQNLPYYVTRHKREAMMSHNLYRNYETQGNQTAAERAKAHRNKCNKAYRRAKADFSNM